MGNKITLAWAEDNQFFKTAALKLLREEASQLIEVLFTVNNGKEMLARLNNQIPDIILLDIRMPIMDGIQTAKIIKEKFDKAKIIAFTEFDFEHNIIEMNKVGVKSFLAKSQAENLIRAITIVHEGGVFFPDEVADILQRYIRRSSTDEIIVTANPNKIKVDLSQQETKLVQLLKVGKTSKEIAIQLQLTVKTIRTYRERLLKKTNTRNVAELLNRLFS